MPAAFVEGQEVVDQSQGSHPSHAAVGSRFNDIDSRGPIQLGAGVAEAIAEFKRGAFTPEDLKQLVFGMGDPFNWTGASTSSQIAELSEKLVAAEARAKGAEDAFAGKKSLSVESVTAIAETMGLQVVTKEDLASLASKVTELTARANDAEAALAAVSKTTEPSGQGQPETEQQ